MEGKSQTGIFRDNISFKSYDCSILTYSYSGLKFLGFVCYPISGAILLLAYREEHDGTDRQHQPFAE